MNSVELSMLPEASAGRAAAQFIVRSKGIGGAATNKQKAGFRRSGNRPFSFVGTTKHCLPLFFSTNFTLLVSIINDKIAFSLTSVYIVNREV